MVGKNINEKKSFPLKSMQKDGVAPALKNFKHIFIIVALNLLLLTFVFADNFPATPPLPASHPTLYSDTITSKTDASPVSIADSQGLFVTGDITTLGNVGIGTTNPGQKLEIAGNIQLPGGARQVLLGNGQGMVDDGGANLKLGSAPGTRVYLAPGGTDTLTALPSGNVGIGTTGPTQQLALGGTVGNFGMSTADASDNAILQISGGGTAGTNRGSYINLYGNEHTQAGKMQFFTGTGSGGGNNFEFYTDQSGGATAKLTILPSGNVGIGTANPIHLLHLYKAGNTELALDRATKAGGSAYVKYVTGGVDDWYVGMPTNQDYYMVSPDGTKGLFIEKSGGNVGIGTTSPGYKLDVQGAGGVLNVKRTSGSTMAALFEYDAASGGLLGLKNTATGDQYHFSVTPDFVISESAVADRFTIKKTSGNVGIGTTSPGSKLEVSGASPVLTIRPTGVGEMSRIRFLNSAGAVIGDFAVDTGGNMAITHTLQDASITFTTKDAIGQSERMRITGSGNVGIGTTSPNRLLQVRSSNPEISLINTNNHEWIMTQGIAGVTNDFQLYESGGAGQFVIKTGGNVGIGTTIPPYKKKVAGDAHATSFPTSSDIRLKKNITQIANVLDKLEKIHGVKFEWNEKYKQLGRATNGTQIGIIAQDVEKEFPELVTTWGNESYRAVDYGRFSAVLLEAVKEQQNEIDELKAQNQYLSEKINGIISRIK